MSNSARNVKKFGGNGGSNLQNEIIGVFNHKTQLLLGITFTVSFKNKATNPDLCKCGRPPHGPTPLRQIS